MLPSATLLSVIFGIVYGHFVAGSYQADSTPFANATDAELIQDGGPSTNRPQRPDVMETSTSDDQRKSPTQTRREESPEPDVVSDYEFNSTTRGLDSTSTATYKPNLSTKPDTAWSGYPTQLPSSFICTNWDPPNYNNVPCPNWTVTSSTVSSLRVRYFTRYNSGEECSVGIRLGLEHKELILSKELKFTFSCELGLTRKLLTVDIRRALGMACHSADDCRSELGGNSECMNIAFRNTSTCRCRSGYTFNGNYCVRIVNPGKRTAKTDAMFTAAIVAVACFTVTVIALFVLFMCNRTIFRRRTQNYLDDVNARRRGGDVFAASDQLAQERLADKPPTYQEVVRNDRMVRGVPPPAYSPTAEVPQRNPDSYFRDVRISRLAAHLRTRRTQADVQSSDVISGDLQADSTNFPADLDVFIEAVLPAANTESINLPADASLPETSETSSSDLGLAISVSTAGTGESGDVFPNALMKSNQVDGTDSTTSSDTDETSKPMTKNHSDVTDDHEPGLAFTLNSVESAALPEETFESGTDAMCSNSRNVTFREHPNLESKELGNDRGVLDIAESGYDNEGFISDA